MCPNRANSIQLVRLMLEQFEYVVAHSGSHTDEPFELSGGGAVDCDPTIVAIDDLDERIRPLDDVGQHLALGKCLGDSRLERFVEPLESRFGALARRDVLEQHGDLPPTGGLDAKCSQLEIAPGREQLALEAD